MRRTRNYVVPAVFSGLMIALMFIQFGMAASSGAHLIVPIVFTLLLLASYGAEILCVRRKKYGAAIAIVVLKNLCLLWFMPLMHFDSFSSVWVSELVSFSPGGIVVSLYLLVAELPSSLFYGSVFVFTYWLPVIASVAEIVLLVGEKREFCPKLPKRGLSSENEAHIPLDLG